MNRTTCLSMTALALLATACGGSGTSNPAPAPPPAAAAPGTGSAADCTGLASRHAAAGVSITSADVREAVAASGATPALPRHCEVTGAVDPHTGVDGQAYLIRFHLRIPIEAAWNGRFVFSGGSGSNGSLGDAMTVAGSPVTPLARGFAVLSQDAGHDNTLNNVPDRGGERAFGYDPRARQDNFHRSQGRIGALAKDIIATFSGKAPTYSYFAGCSKGGQEAAMVSQRYPDLFDGIVVGNPLLAAPLASMVRPAHIAQNFAALARAQGRFDRNGLPFLNKTFTDADLATLGAGVAAQCDLLDGIADGMSQDFEACTAAFKPATLACAPGKDGACLSTEQVAAIERQFAGLPGDQPWMVDMALVEGQFRSWWLGRHDAPQTSNNWVGRAVSTMYVTPPEPVHATLNNGSEPYRWLLGFGLESGIAGIHRTTPTFPVSSWDLSFATGTDLSAFKRRGGKMVVYHGVADGAFTIAQTRDWIRNIDATNGAPATDVVRMFAVPGMGHCRGGPATSEFDMLAAVQDWVENGKAPDTVIATAPAGTPWPGRTRPLCPYPKVARYVGGSIEDAASFACR